jgi:hypothetical protein
MKNTIKVIFFIFSLFILLQPAYCQEKDTINHLVYQLGEKGKPGEEAHVALVKIGEASVPALCKALQKLDPSMSNVRDAATLFGVIMTLGKISKTKPQTMKKSIPALLDTCRNLKNSAARSAIVSGVSILFGSAVIPYLIDYFKATQEHPPANDKNTITTQGLVSYIFINMEKTSPGSVNTILNYLEKELKASKGTLRKMFIAQVVNLAPDSKRAITILEQSRLSETDSQMKKFIEDTLENAKGK